MNKSEALAERDRLQRLLAVYDDYRTASGAEPFDLPRDVPPDRAAKVRARIANLDKIIADHGN